MTTEPRRILIVGPTPPPCHGVAAFTRELLEHAGGKRFELLHLDTSDRRDLSNLGQWDLANIRRFLYEWGRVPLSRFIPSGDGWVVIPKWIAEAPEQTCMIPVVDKPGDILVGLAGGAGKHSLIFIGGYAEAIAGPIRK